MLVWLSTFTVMPCLHACKHTVSVFSTVTAAKVFLHDHQPLLHIRQEMDLCFRPADFIISFGLNVQITFYGSHTRL